jgi:membrane protein
VRRITEFGKIFGEGVSAFFEEEAHSRGAAIAFYTMTAMGPILYISAWIAGLVLGAHVAHDRVIYEVRHVVGRDTAAMLQAAIEGSSKMHGGFWGTIVGAIVLVLTSGGVFVEVQSALNCIWKVQRPAFSWPRFLASWGESILMVMGLGLLLCVSVLINALVGAFGAYFERLFGIGSWVVWLLNFAVSSTLITVLFASIYMVLPNRDLKWGDVIMGAIVTTVLILIGEYLIAFYLAMTAIGHRYGSAGGAMAILMWIYYSVQVFLLGAEFTKAWSLRHGSAAARAVAKAESREYRLDEAA